MLLFCLSELNNNLYLDCFGQLVVWSVAFTDDGWRANLHGLHLVYDLICSVSQVCFLYLGISALVLFYGSWILSALFIHQLGIHLGILSILFGIFQLCFDHTSYASYIPASIILILGPLCPSIFLILGPNVSNLYDFVR